MTSLWEQLAQSALAKWIAGSAWPYPALEGMHIFGLGLLFGPIILMDLRILGLGSHLPMGGLGRFLLPCVWTGFLINATSGTLLFISNATGFAANSAFRVKMSLIALAGLNALLFHWRAYGQTVAMAPGARAPAAAVGAALVSMCLWLGAIVAGRLIAYVD